MMDDNYDHTESRNARKRNVIKQSSSSHHIPSNKGQFSPTTQPTTSQINPQMQPDMSTDKNSGKG
jgi:hypothetical protein